MKLGVTVKKPHCYFTFFYFTIFFFGYRVDFSRNCDFDFFFWPNVEMHREEGGRGEVGGGGA